MASPTGTQAVDRALGLLTQVMAAPSALTFGEMQASSGLAKSTLSRLLSSLEAAGLIHRTPGGLIRPGVALTRFAHVHQPNEELLEFAEPAMQALQADACAYVCIAPLQDTAQRYADAQQIAVLSGLTLATLLQKPLMKQP